MDRGRRQQQFPPQHRADAAGVRARRGPLSLRRRWQPAHRLLPRHGPDDPRPQPGLRCARRCTSRSTGASSSRARAELEAEAARLVCEMVPCAERVRFGSSGSEVVQARHAPRPRRDRPPDHPEVRGPLSRLVRQRSVVDGARAQRGRPGRQPRCPSRAAPGRIRRPRTGSRSCPGTISTAWRGASRKGDVAGVIMEAAMCNAGAIHPAPGYLEGAREACTRHGTRPDLRRGHHRLPARAGRRAGALRRHPRPCDLRQGDRQRLSGGGARGPGRPARPLRHRRRGAWRHLQRAMHRHGGDGRDPARSDAGALRDPRDPRHAADARASKRRSAAPASGPSSPASPASSMSASASTRRRAITATSRGSTAPPMSPSRRRSCAAACARSSAAHGSSRSSMTTRSSTRRSRRSKGGPGGRPALAL